MRHLANDKQTLAICMRVSPTFNSVVAPILNQTVTLSGSTGLFKHLKPPWYHAPRKTQIKKLNLAYISQVDFVLHDDKACSDRSPRHDTLYADLLRISRNTHVGTGDRCRCVRAFVPRKLCVKADLFVPTNAPIDKTVLVGQPPFYHPEYQGPTVRAPLHGPLVLIFLSRSSDSDTLSRRQSGSYDWTNAVSSLNPTTVLMHEYPKEIVFVNIERAAGQSLGLAGTESNLCEEVQSLYTAKFRSGLKIAPLVAEPRWSKKDRKKLLISIEAARSTKFAFVTMKDYLTKWDWKGELTDREIKPWLEAIEQDRNGV